MNIPPMYCIVWTFVWLNLILLGSNSIFLLRLYMRSSILAAVEFNENCLAERRLQIYWWSVLECPPEMTYIYKSPFY